MRFGKLKIFVAISLVIFFIVVANTIAFGLASKNGQTVQAPSNNLIYDNKTSTAASDKSNSPSTTVDYTVVASPDAGTSANSVNNNQPVVQQPVQSQPIVIQQTTRTRAS